MKKALIAIVIVAVLGAAWFLGSPLLFDRTVDEGLDFLTDDGRVDMTAVMAVPEAERLDHMDDIMEAAASAPDSEMDEAMPASEPRIVASGQFVDADSVHKGSGTANLYALPDNSHVLRFEDFRTTNGPDLVVYLARHPSPASASDVTDGGFLSLGDLKGNVGSQNYPIPAGTDLSEFNSVVIWCELFGVLFSPAALERT
ncbi:MAG: DM13 domain-containing protein [Woeseiaceae bacterium]|nr:DM13 domain-containing protein [Woeseiaceae bacterium]